MRRRKKMKIRVTKLTDSYFTLKGVGTFKHLFKWSYVPDVKDFEVLLSHCYELITDWELEIV